MLLPVGAGIWIVGKLMDSVIGGALALVGIIAFLMGLVGLVKAVVNRRRQRDPKQAQ